MTPFIFSFVCSGLATLFIVRTGTFHSHLTADHDLNGVQKFHSTPVPRIGGAGIFLALLLNAASLWMNNRAYLSFYLLLLLPCSLVFSAGLLEDMTKRVSVQVRLTATMLAALIGSFLLRATVRTLDIQILNTILQINVVAMAFTMVAVGGVANAINLIDGFNGLAGMVSVMVLLGLGLVAHLVNDPMIFNISMIAAGAVMGFLIWNYPRAQIFLGDGGAYLIGFVIAELSVLLNERHRQISALFPLLVMIYPVFETLFTIYRRKFIRGRSPGSPDALHLHQLINKRVVRWRVSGKSGSIRSRGNAMTSPYLWVLNLLAIVPAISFWNRPVALVVFIFLFMTVYVWLYSRIVRFRTPRWLFLPYTSSLSRPGKENVIIVTGDAIEQIDSAS